MKHQAIVIMGGGTGIYPVVTALQSLKADISTIVAVSDSGGSTGRIRDEFGFPPVGDLRQSLAALADPESQRWIRDVLLYRFNKGSGLKGHNLGNLILTALQDMTGSTTDALEVAEKIFALEGSVIPVTEDNVHLKITYTDGSSTIGEHILDEHTPKPKTIDHVELEPIGTLNPTAEKAIVTADHIIIGPGDYYASLQAVLVAKGIKEAFAQSSAKVYYIANLMTRHTQTHDMAASEHVHGIEESINKKISTIILNNEPIPKKILEYYARENEYPVVDDLLKDTRVHRANLIHTAVQSQHAADTVQRSLLRHNIKKLRAVFTELGLSD